MVRHDRRGGRAVFGRPKLKERERAIELRRKGHTYSEILKEVPVAKSSLSLWLGEVGLTKRQKQRITDKKLAAMRRGGEARRQQRIDSTAKIYAESSRAVGLLTRREQWLIGTALYWAEGGKEKEWRPSGSMVDFSNSDPQMARLFIRWLESVCRVRREDIRVSIYIHETSKYRLPEVIAHWSKWTDFPKSEFRYVYFKKNKPKTKRKNIGQTYFGNVRIRVASSSVLLRTIAGWVQGICADQSGLV